MQESDFSPGRWPWGLCYLPVTWQISTLRCIFWIMLLCRRILTTCSAHRLHEDIYRLWFLGFASRRGKSFGGTIGSCGSLTIAILQSSDTWLDHEMIGNVMRLFLFWIASNSNTAYPAHSTRGLKTRLALVIHTTQRIGRTVMSGLREGIH